MKHKSASIQPDLFEQDEPRVLPALWLADCPFMSETTAARCLEAWHACVGALREAGKLPTAPKAVTAKKKAPPKAKPAALAATETTATPVETVETTAAT